MEFEKARREMIEKIGQVYGLKSPEVLGVMGETLRHEFVAGKYKKLAYSDQPLDIGYGQTMSQPYTVALMTHLAVTNSELKIQNSKVKLKTQKFRKVLEIGTGSGYQAAILSCFFDDVYTLEIIPELAEKASKTLVRLGYKNVFVRTGSGGGGWHEKSPFDAIIVTAGMREVPEELFDQLKVGGIIVAPVGKGYDKAMTKFTKINPEFQTTNNKSKLNIKATKISKSEFLTETFGTFHFVPFTE